MARTIKKVKKMVKPKKAEEEKPAKPATVHPKTVSKPVADLAPKTEVVAPVSKAVTPKAEVVASAPKAIKATPKKQPRKALLTDIDELRGLAKSNKIADADKLTRRDLILKLNQAGVLTKDFLQQKQREAHDNN